jgi:hypothetical protein
LAQKTDPSGVFFLALAGKEVKKVSIAEIFKSIKEAQKESDERAALGIHRILLGCDVATMDCIKDQCRFCANKGKHNSNPPYKQPFLYP